MGYKVKGYEIIYQDKPLDTMIARLMSGDAVFDQFKPLRINPLANIKISNAAAVYHDPRGPSGQIAVDRKFVPPLPRIGALFAANDGFNTATERRCTTICVGGEQPRLHQIRLQPPDQLLEPKIGAWIDFPTLANRGEGGFVPRQVRFVRSSPRQRTGVHVELARVQVRGQQRELFFGAGTVKRWDDL